MVPFLEEGLAIEQGNLTLDSDLIIGVDSGSKTTEALPILGTLPTTLEASPVLEVSSNLSEEVLGEAQEEGEEIQVGRRRLIQRSNNNNNCKEPCSSHFNEPCSNIECEPLERKVESLNPIPVQIEDTSHAPPVSGKGRSLINKIDSWSELPNSSFACDIIKKGVRLPFKDKKIAQRSLKKHGISRYYSPRKRQVLEEECDRLLNLGVLEQIPRDSIFYSNHIFYKVKPDGKIRLIFDMKNLNTLIRKPTFSMLKSKSIFPYLHLHKWAGKLDLKDAYWHVPLHPSAQKYLTFKLGRRKFKWKVVPFGLKTAPYIFSKIMSTVVKYIRKKYNIIIFNYLDDILILAEEFHKCESHIKKVIKILENLGWCISFNKSVIRPVQDIGFLGVQYDLINKTMRPMDKNIDKCIKMVKTTSNLIKCDLKIYQSLIGSLNFCSYYTPFGRLHIKPLHRYHGYFSQGYRTIPPSFKTFLKAWERPDMYTEINIPKSSIDLDLFTDASNLGWGGALVSTDNICFTNGTWSQHEEILHINIKELLACIHSIKHFKDKLRDKVVLIHIDSKVTKAWISKQGSIRNQLAHDYISELILLKRKHNIQIHTRWIRGKNNRIADSLSRDFSPIHPETTLNEQFYKQICTEMNFFPKIDLFSNGFNSKCTNFCSSIPHAKSISNDALSISWKNLHLLYAFPPGFLLHKVAFKIYSECRNNMLFCSIAQGTEPWIPLVRAVCKLQKSYQVEIEDYQIVPKDVTSLSARRPLNLIVFKI